MQPVTRFQELRIVVSLLVFLTLMNLLFKWQVVEHFVTNKKPFCNFSLELQNLSLPHCLTLKPFIFLCLSVGN